MSDPTTPPQNPGNPENPDENTHPPTPPQPESGPIDVRELLESTRKLFSSEELDKSLEQVGYTPDPLATPSPDGLDSPLLDPSSPGKPPWPDTISSMTPVNPAPVIEPRSKPQHFPGGASGLLAGLADADLADSDSDSDSAEIGPPPRRGVNVLSLVAFVLAITLSPLAVIFGYIALGQARRAHQRGETLAVWAIGLGWVVLAAWLVGIFALVWIGTQQGVTLESLQELVELFRIP